MNSLLIISIFWIKFSHDILTVVNPSHREGVCYSFVGFNSDTVVTHKGRTYKLSANYLLEFKISGFKISTISFYIIATAKG